MTTILVSTIYARNTVNDEDNKYGVICDRSDDDNNHYRTDTLSYISKGNDGMKHASSFSQNRNSFSHTSHIYLFVDVLIIYFVLLFFPCEGASLRSISSGDCLQILSLTVSDNKGALALLLYIYYNVFSNYQK